MSDVPTTEELLEDAAWLRRLAITLAGNSFDADDLVQESRIAAWQKHPETDRSLRPWLAKVIRDVARMSRRSNHRRESREQAALEEQQPSQPDALLAQMRLHRLLVDLVLELDEPFRSTIVARFVEGRSAASIARLLGIPNSTVRARLREALSRLRYQLDKQNGDRKAWAPAVLAFAHGGIQMAKPTKLILAVVALMVLLLGAIVLFVHPMRGDGGGTTASTRSSETTMSSGAAPAGPSVTAAAADARTPLQPVSEHRAAERAAMLAAIASARDARDHRTAPTARTPATPGAPMSTGSDSTATTLDIVDNTGDTSEWAKRALHTLNNLLGQCFDLGLAEDANLAGTIEIEFTLVGEPNVGGLLEKVQIVDADTTITQQTIRDCLTQQLYALELVPPPDGVTIKRKIHLKVP